MSKIISKIIIPTVIVISMISSQVILPLQAYADNTFLDYDNPNKDGNNPPFKLNFGNVTPQLLTSVVSCTGIENKLAGKLIELNDLVKKELDKLLKKAGDAVKDALMSKAKRIAKEQALEAARKAALTAGAAAGTAASATVAGTGTPGASQGILAVITDVQHPTTEKVELTPEERKAAEKAEEEKIKAAAKLEKQQKTERCINGIAIRLARNQLTSMTKYTMNWINSGFNGDPFFVRNVDSFMSSIEDQILQKEINLFKNPANSAQYPYGRNFAQGAISANQAAKNFADTMKQDLTSYLTPGSTPQSFARNFSEGGWDGWYALTQHPKNNPLGFTLEQAQHLNDEQTRTVQNAKDELNQGGGYLSQKKCVEYAKADPDDVKSLYQNPDGSPKCLKYETVTPGSNIKTKVDTYVNTPERQLELVKTMDDALNALFAFLLSKFENQGLASLRSSTNNFTSTTTGGLGSNQIFDTLGNLISGGTGTGTGLPSAGGGSFDLTRDLGNTYTDQSAGNNWTIQKSGVLQIQYDYLNLVNKSKTVLANVVPTLGKLDYCIPGPNSSWKDNIQDSVNSYLDSLNNGGQVTIDPSTIEDKIEDYTNGIDSTYGPTSPMQDPSAGNTKYLKMSTAGLNLTKDILSYSEAVSSAQDDYVSVISESTSNIAKLNAIKIKVNAIISDAQERRATKRAAAGLPRVGNACLTKEKVTYLDNGVIK